MIIIIIIVVKQFLRKLFLLKNNNSYFYYSKNIRFLEHNLIFCVIGNEMDLFQKYCFMTIAKI